MGRSGRRLKNAEQQASARVPTRQAESLRHGGSVLATVAVVVFAAATLHAQSHGVDYNFFDSRSLVEAGATAALSEASGVHAPPVSAEPETIARAFLEDRREQFALTGTTVFSLPLERRYESAAA